jgi:glutathione synthase
MQMRWLVVLDPLDGLKPRTDTSLAVINRARKEGIEVDTATIEQLYFEEGARVMACGADGATQKRLLGGYDLIFMRKEPPYDMRFHYATQLLSLGDTLVLNSPSSLRDFNEKLIVLPFAKYMPPTLVAAELSVIGDFIGRHGKVVVKSLDSFQGKSVQLLEEYEAATLEDFTGKGTRPVMVQKFLDQVYDGDKRVITLGDQVLGAALRRPTQGYHANFANSDALQSPLSEREQAALDELCPWMVSQGIHFSGLDFIGGFLTEINITCPTGIIQISELEGRDLAAEIVDYFSELADRRSEAG